VGAAAAAAGRAGSGWQARAPAVAWAWLAGLPSLLCGERGEGRPRHRLHHAPRTLGVRGRERLRVEKIGDVVSGGFLLLVLLILRLLSRCHPAQLLLLQIVHHVLGDPQQGVCHVRCEHLG